ncbi:MAG: hypothetical protein H6732_19320 [Alphaproteobacteria bacterium]|nr:hypothetical protein [Alphaproteobacteria bacterium]
MPPGPTPRPVRSTGVRAAPALLAFLAGVGACRPPCGIDEPAWQTDEPRFAPARRILRDHLAGFRPEARCVARVTVAPPSPDRPTGPGSAIGLYDPRFGELSILEPVSAWLLPETVTHEACHGSDFGTGFVDAHPDIDWLGAVDTWEALHRGEDREAFALLCEGGQPSLSWLHHATSRCGGGALAEITGAALAELTTGRGPEVFDLVRSGQATTWPPAGAANPGIEAISPLGRPGLVLVVFADDPEPRRSIFVDVETGSEVPFDYHELERPRPTIALAPVVDGATWLPMHWHVLRGARDGPRTALLIASYARYTAMQSVLVRVDLDGGHGPALADLCLEPARTYVLARWGDETWLLSHSRDQLRASRVISSTREDR